jgi:hypothetical protein
MTGNKYFIVSAKVSSTKIVRSALAINTPELKTHKREHINTHHEFDMPPVVLSAELKLAF